MNSSNSFITPAPKRQRTNSEYNKNIKPMPSLVVHARNLSDSVGENDIAQSLERYGQINYIVMMHKKRQALIEFNDISSSTNCVNDALRLNVMIGGSPAFLNYSSSSKIIRPGEDATKENQVLLITVINPLYPISVDIIHSICSAVGGQVLRIVIFRKNGVQAMVEFDSVETAKLAKQSLNGADIYAGCCTLKIEYAKPTKLNVLRNDKDSWDYTKDPSSIPNNYTNSDNFKKQPLLQTPHGTSYPSNTSFNFGQSQSLDQLQFSQTNAKKFEDEQMVVPNGTRGIPFNKSSLISMKQDFNLDEPYAAVVAAAAVEMQSQHNQVVLMVYNLEKLNCDRLFNLFCLYGNVDRIKFLISKESAAMLQMSHPDSLYYVLSYLNNISIFGKKLQINVSKQTVLKPVSKPTQLADGTPTFKDYCSSRNNRYQTAEAAQKNKPLPPANVLHWYNAPPNMTESQIIDIFVKADAKPPSKVKVFPKKSEKCSTGLAEWNNITESVEALVLANHSEIHHPTSKFPYIFKLCFSSTPIIDQQHQ